MKKSVTAWLVIVLVLALSVSPKSQWNNYGPPAGTHSGQDNWCVCYGPHHEAGIAGDSGYTFSYLYDPIYVLQYVDQLSYDRFGYSVRSIQFPNEGGYNRTSCTSYCESWALDDSDPLCATGNLGGGAGFTEMVFMVDWTDTDFSAGGSWRGGSLLIRGAARNQSQALAHRVPSPGEPRSLFFR